MPLFQSTHPLRGATWRPHAVRPGQQQISIHAPLAGCDPRCPSCSVPPINFNPRTPCGVRPKLYIWTREAVAFQSTHPLRGATASEFAAAVHSHISIHAPLAGCDARHAWPCAAGNISIHAPLAGCDVQPRFFIRHGFAFQSTHPLRGATISARPCSLYICISIHAPLAGCDILQLLPGVGIPQFQSTHPLRGATQGLPPSAQDHPISIHAPLAGCD